MYIFERIKNKISSKGISIIRLHSRSTARQRTQSKSGHVSTTCPFHEKSTCLPGPTPGSTLVRLGIVGKQMGKSQEGSLRAVSVQIGDGIR